jgi:hypothetical protein
MLGSKCERVGFGRKVDGVHAPIRAFGDISSYSPSQRDYDLRRSP